MRFRPVSAVAARQGGSAAVATGLVGANSIPSATAPSASQNASYEELVLGASVLGSPDSVSAASMVSTTGTKSVLSKAVPLKSAVSALATGGSLSRSGSNFFSPTKRRGGGKKRSMFRSPTLRSPLRNLSPNERSTKGGKSNNEGTGGMKLFSSPSFRRTRRDRDLPTSAKTSKSAATASTAQSFQIYSPEPSASSKSFSQRGSSLRKERKRHKPVQDEMLLNDRAPMNVAETSTPAPKETPAPSEPPKETPLTTPKKNGTYTFIYPKDTVSLPNSKIIEHFHSIETKAVAEGEDDSGPARIVISPDHVSATTAPTDSCNVTASHQARLDHAGTNLLSLESVIIPAIAHEERLALKQMEAKAVREGDIETEAEILMCRLTVNELTTAASIGARRSRLEREESERKEDQLRREREKLEREQKRKEGEIAQQRRKVERIRRRKVEKERAFRERKKNLPRNKEMYREVAVLMTELAQLQKEERMWKQAEVKLDKTEEELEGRMEKAADEEEDEVVESSAVEQEEADRLDSSIWDAVDDITLSANRINETLRTVTALMEESDAARKELYKKYTDDHQFRGYRGMKDAKGLVLALSQDDC